MLRLRSAQATGDGIPKKQIFYPYLAEIYL
jgi:hypothetical protein